MGVDWGFAPDPYAFIRLHYDPARETIFLPDELHALRKTNSETADELLTRGYTDAVITCDSAEPKSVADYRSLDPKSTKNPALDYYHPEDFYEDLYDDSGTMWTQRTIGKNTGNNIWVYSFALRL